MELPFFQEWNKKNRLPRWFWQRIWEYPFVCLNIPKYENNLDVCGTYPFVLFKHFPNTISLDNRDLNKQDHKFHKDKWPAGKLVVANAMAMPFKDEEFRYSFSISAIEETPDPLLVLKEMLRVTGERVVITMDVSNKLGVSGENLRKILDFLKVELPEHPEDILKSDSPRQKSFGQRIRPQFNDIKVLGIVIDKFEPAKKSVGILIPHCESLPFLKVCVAAIKKQQRLDVTQHIYILDDASKDGSFEQVKELWQGDRKISLIPVNRANKRIPDVGQLLDIGLSHVKEQYTAMIDADVFPMHPDWVSFPIYLLEKYGCSSVGSDTGLSAAYLNKVKGNWNNSKEYLRRQAFGLYDNSWFTCTNNFFRVARTADAKVVSALVGYRRVANPINKLLRMLVGENITARMYSALNLFPNADNGVLANYFIDVNRLGPKFVMPITGWVGRTPNDGVFGQNILNLIFHFALSSRAMSLSHREITNAGSDYEGYSGQILKEGFSEPLLKELFEKSSAIKNELWGADGWNEKQFENFAKLFEEYKKTFGANKP